MKKMIQLLFLFIITLLLIQGNLSVIATQNALSFWFNQLVPSMFVSMTLISLANSYDAFDLLTHIKPLQKIFKCNQGGLSLLISCILLGSPASVILLEENIKEGKLSTSSAKHILYCISMATPSFIILTCGSVFFKSSQLGFLLWTTQICVCLLFFLVLPHDTININKNSYTYPFFISLKKAITRNAIALFYIGGYIMMFLTMFSLFSSLIPKDLVPYLLSISEFSLGCQNITSSTSSLILKIGLVSMCLGFNGLCVHFQIFSICETIKPNYFNFLCLRCLQACLSFSVAIILFLLLQRFPLV